MRDALKDMGLAMPGTLLMLLILKIKTRKNDWLA
jgi:hypothetical protein